MPRRWIRQRRLGRYKTSEVRGAVVLTLRLKAEKDILPQAKRSSSDILGDPRTSNRELIMSLIEIKKLNKAYESGEECVMALVDVDLNIERGEFISVMGPSGSGKSTLLTILGGLNHPTKGDVVVDDIPIYKLSLEKLADFRREYLGFIFQSFQLIPYLTVIENVMLPLSITQRTNREQVTMAEEILERIGLRGKGNRLPDQLSGQFPQHRWKRRCWRSQCCRLQQGLTRLHRSGL